MINKKGEENLLVEYIIFIVFSIAFVAIFIFVLNKIGNGETLYEQIYAKEIALAIEQAKPGMQINIDISKGLKLSKNMSIVITQPGETAGNVKVTIKQGKGYTYSFFSDYTVENVIQGNQLILKIKERT